MFKLFVYGTLLPGNVRGTILAQEKRLGPDAVIDHKLVDCGSYPALVYSPGNHVLGEAFEVRDSLRDSLDCIEDEGNLYERKEVVLKSGLKAETYVYLKDASRFPEIPLDAQPYRSVK